MQWSEPFRNVSHPHGHKEKALNVTWVKLPRKCLLEFEESWRRACSLELDALLCASNSKAVAEPADLREHLLRDWKEHCALAPGCPLHLWRLVPTAPFSKKDPDILWWHCLGKWLRLHRFIGYFWKVAVFRVSSDHLWRAGTRGWESCVAPILLYRAEAMSSAG